MRTSVLTAFGITLLCAVPLHAAGPVFDPAALATLETKAKNAQARDQAYLYAEVMRGMGELASRQLSAGSSEEAAQTLVRLEEFAGLIDAGVSHDARKLKDAEILMRETAVRLQGALHEASMDDRPNVQHTLTRLDALESKVMAEVFAH